MSLLQLCEAVKDMEVVEVGQYLEEGMPAHPATPGFIKCAGMGSAWGTAAMTSS